MLKAYQQRKHLPVVTPKGDPLIGTLGSIAGTTIGAAIGGPPGAAIGGALGSQLGNVASGAEINPTEMALSGLTSGLSAGTKAATGASQGLESAKQGVVNASNALQSASGSAATEAAQAQYDSAIKALQNAGMKSMEAESSMFNNPFGKAANSVKSVFMSDGGQVKKEEKKKMVLPEDFDFSKLIPMSEAEQQQRASVDQQSARKVKPKPIKLASGGMAKGPLCSSCEAQYKACGGMTKRY